jgi:CheY-like chemotaxis protein
MPEEKEPVQKYEILCYTCKAPFDALEAIWCNCLVSERTLVCPSCMNCFCKAPVSYKDRVWSSAPEALWDRRYEEHQKDSMPIRNPTPETAKHPLVLIVDDDLMIQKIAARIIEKLGYGVVVANNGSEGLDLVKRYHPELVLTDALMPKMDGREMAKAINKSGDYDFPLHRHQI